MQACVLQSACLGIGSSSRSAALLEYQKAALEVGKHGQSLSDMARAGVFDLRAYQQLQCSEGYTGPLCGVCAEGFGRVQMMECRKCPEKERNDGALASPAGEFPAALAHMSARAAWLYLRDLAVVSSPERCGTCATCVRA